MNQADKFLSRYDRIGAIIRKFPGISATQLQLATRSLSVADRAEVVEALVEDGSIRVETAKKPNVGRPLTTYWPIAGSVPVSQFDDDEEDVMKAQEARDRQDRISLARRRFNRELAKCGVDPSEFLPIR